jgi:hypothetical protein
MLWVRISSQSAEGRRKPYYELSRAFKSFQELSREDNRS